MRLRIDGEIVDVNEVPELDKNKNHTIEVVVDRLVVKEGIETSCRLYRNRVRAFRRTINSRCH